MLLYKEAACPKRSDDETMAAPSTSSDVPAAITVLEQCRVSPSHDGPFGEVSIPLTFFDVPWLDNHPVQRLFFYRWPGLTTTHFAASALPRLKRSLSLALCHYYPLIGRLEPLPRSSKRLHIVCTDADSVTFTVAECVVEDGDYFHHLAGNHPRRVEMFRPLVPGMISASALLALQVTVFPGAGVCVGVSIGHAACDGSGFVSFMKAWASACRSEENEAPPAGELPVIDRTLVSDPGGELYTALFDSLKYLAGLSWPAVEGPDVERSTFLLRRAHIEELRRRVSEQRPPAPPVLRYSSFVLTCAYVWVCLLKAGWPPQGEEDAAYLIFTVNCRGRFRPPIPAAYFGNCLGPCTMRARRSDLLGVDGVGLAAEVIAHAVASQGHGDQLLEWPKECFPQMAVWLRGRPLSISGSPRFGVYGTDFGWGRPAKVEVVGIEKSGAMALAESGEEDGGIEVGLALRSPEMARFTSLFTAGLEDAGNGRGRPG
ncbi:hypothetical protein Taro_006231 [Colocasia esculenta]|uniref:Uncharacterized protein n=1 Tax=Colocasia esculenta TaxID=4460 RepID=A0A843TQG2_COLES|nr:hypothetical protein [Colocasia esculenta]